MDWISIAALIISLGVLIVMYRNQLERRHGEIAKLHSDFMQKFSATDYRMRSIQMHLETARLEFRRLPEDEYKYFLIEIIPETIKEVKEIIQKIEQHKIDLEKINTKESNRADVLMLFQSVEHNITSVNDQALRLEKKTLEMMDYLHKALEKNDEQSENKSD